LIYGFDLSAPSEHIYNFQAPLNVLPLSCVNTCGINPIHHSSRIFLNKIKQCRPDIRDLLFFTHSNKVHILWQSFPHRGWKTHISDWKSVISAGWRDIDLGLLVIILDVNK
jgi:hypothetical protein